MSPLISFSAGRLVLPGLTVPLAAFAVADLVNPLWSPAEAMVSHYVHAPRGGWLIPAGTLVLAAASAAVLRLAVVRSRGGRGGLALLGVWVLGLLVAGVFPADPPGRWDEPPTVAGMLHGVAALVAFAALPVAAVLLTRVWRRDPRFASVGAAPAVTAGMAVVALALLVVTFVDVQGGPSLAVGPWPTVIGLAERVMLWTYVAWLVVAARGLDRIGRQPGRPARRPQGAGRPFG